MKELKIESTKARIVHNKHKIKHLATKPIAKEFWRPKSEDEFHELADELLVWVKLETSTDINDFPLSKNISPYRFKRFDNQHFQEALEVAKYTISSRNRKLVNAKEFEKEVYFKELYLLDMDYKESEDDKIARKVAGIKQAMGDIILQDHMLINKKD